MRWDEIAERLLIWIGKHDMSVRQFARMAGVPEACMYALLGRRAGLSLRSIYKICATHHISMDWLMGLRR